MQVSPGIQLLIAEDSPIVRERLVSLAGEYLKPQAIQTAATGADAVAAFDRSRPDAVLLDIGLPDMSGLAVLEHIRRHGDSTEVIIFTNSSGPEMVARCHLLGADHFVDKAQDVGPVIELLRTIAQAGDRDAASDAPNETLSPPQHDGFVPPMRSTAKPVSLLIVEEDVSRASPLVQSLERKLPIGSTIAQAKSLMPALDLMKASAFDVILLDLGLPDCEQIVALVAVRSANPDAAIIVLTAQDDDGTVDSALVAGADDYFVKGELSVVGLTRAIIYAAEGKRYERALSVSLRSRTRIMDSSADVICTLDAAGRFAEVGAASASTWGYEPAELVGRHAREYASVEDHPQTDAFVTSVRGGETVRGFEQRFLRSDGSAVPMMWSGAWSATDRLMYCVARDVSERVAAQEKLKAQEAQYRVLFESNPNPMWVYGRDDLRILAVNDAAVGQYGYSRAEFLGLTLFALRPSEDGERLRQAISDEGTAPRYAGAWRHTRKDGSLMLVDVYTTATTFSGAPARMAVLVDVTERKRADELLQQSERSHRALAEQLEVEQARLLAAQHVAKIGNWEIDLCTHASTWSDEAYRILEIAPEPGPSHQRFLQVVHPEDLGAVEAAASACFSERSPCAQEHRLLLSDGRIKFVEHRWLVTRDENGEPLRATGTIQDITERKQAELALRRSEAELRTLVESIPQIVWITQPDGRHIHFNQQWIDYTGSSVGESLGDGWNRLFHPQDRARAVKRWQAATQSGEVYEVEYRLRRHDGVYHWMLGRALPLRDATGAVVKWFGTCTDIEELKQAEQIAQQKALEQRELAAQLATERARLVAAQMVAKVGDWDADFTTETRTWSDQFYRILELDPKRGGASHARFMEMVHPEDHAAMKAASAASLQGTSPASLKHRLLMPDGRIKYVEQHWQVICDSEGKAVHATGTLQDMTEREERQEVLRRSERNLALAQRVSHTGSWEIIPDATTEPEQRDLHWSEEQFRIFGFEPGAVHATQALFFSLVHPGDRERLRAAFSRSFETGQPYDLEHRITRPDGSERDVHELAEFIRDEETGAVIRIIGSTQDITERKQAERAAARTLQRLSDAQRLGQIGDWEWDIATQAITWSPQVFAIFGRDPSLGPPQSYEEYAGLYDSTNAALLRASITLATESGEAQEHELALTRADGQRIHLHALVVPRHDETGQVIGLAGTVQDVTARKRTEAAASRLLSVLEVSLNEIYIFDAETLRFEYVNECALRNLRYSMEEMRAQTPLDLKPEFTAERFHEMIAPLRRQEKPKVIFETVHRRADGSLYPVEVHLQLVQRGEKEVFLAVINDITARTRAAEELRQKDNLIRIAGRMTETGGWALEISEQRVFWSDEVCNILGYPHNAKPSLAEGLALYPRPWREVVAAGIGDCAENGTPFDAEVEVLTATGERLWVRVCCEAERDETGAIQRVQGAFQDISRRRRADAALSDAHRKYLSIFENAAEGIFQITPAGAFISANPALARMTGYESPEELIRERRDVGQQSYCDPAKWQEFQRLIAEAGVVTNFEHDVKHRDGSIFSVSENTRMVTDDDGKFLYYEGSVQDITERRRSEAARNRLVEILDATTDLVSIADLEGRLQYLNPAGRKMLGLAQDTDIAAKAINDFLPDPDTHPIIRKAVPAAVREGSWSGETVLLDHEGFAVHVSQVVLSHRNPTGEVDVVSTIARDITERKRAELELEELNKQLLATSRQAGMAEVATSVLHNVGNVLNSVNVSCSIISEKVRASRIGTVSKTAELLSDHADDLAAFFTTDSAGRQLPAFLTKLSERLVDEQKVILSELQSLSHNITHIKEIVAVQQSYAKVRGLRETLSIADLIQDALRINAESLSRHNVEIIQEFTVLGSASVDKHKVLQILVNLVRNAKHALVDSGRNDKRLTVRVAPCDDARFVVSVSDNGIGIAPQHITRVFAHGFTTKKNGHGFGLHSGVLAAREMGGSLTVHSDGIGCGATFSLELPLDGEATV